MDNKMDNELDFRVGDVVCDIRFGTGKVESVGPGEDWPISVDFGSEPKRLYSRIGKHVVDDECRSLYHGTWEQVFGNLPDLKPKRKVKRWVNLYCRENQIIAGHAYPRPEEARAVRDDNLVAVAVEIEVDE